VLIAAGPSYAGISDWIRTGGGHVRDDAVMTALAIHVKETTSERTRIAVVWAGTVPYFTRRPAIDLLGKSDPVIARHPPVLPFRPGHDRFDYDYSIGVLRPDLVVDLWEPKPRAFELLARLEYERVFGTVYARRGGGVDVGRLRGWGTEMARSLAEPP
jgi:hypothetical protein